MNIQEIAATASRAIVAQCIMKVASDDRWRPSLALVAGAHRWRPSLASIAGARRWRATLNEWSAELTTRLGLAVTA